MTPPQRPTLRLPEGVGVTRKIMIFVKVSLRCGLAYSTPSDTRAFSIAPSFTVVTQAESAQDPCARSSFLV